MRIVKGLRVRRWEAASQGKSRSLRRYGASRCKGRSLSAKRLAGFAIHVTSAVIDVNGKLVVAGQRSKKMRIRKKMRHTGGANPSHERVGPGRWKRDDVMSLWLAE